MNLSNIWNWIFYENRPIRTLQAASIIRFVSSFLMGVLLIQCGVDIGIVGRLEFFLFLSALLSTFWIQGIKNGMLSFFPDIPKPNDRLFFRSLFIGLIILSFLISIIYFLGELSFSVLSHSKISLGGYKFLLILYLLFIIPSSICDYILFLRKQYKEVVLFSAFFSVAQLIALVMPLVKGYDIYYALCLLLYVYVFKFIVTFFLVTRFRFFSIRLAEVITFSIFCFPLILHAFLGIMMEYFDSYLVSLYFDESIFVKFRYGARELPFSALLVSGIVAAMIPAYKEDKKSALTKMYDDLDKLIPILFVVASSLMLLSPLIFVTIYDQSFLLSSKVFNIYVLVLLSRVILPSVIFYANNKNWHLMFFGLAEFVANVVLSIYLMNKVGVLGIAWATVIVYVLHTMALVLYAKKYLHENLNNYLNVKRYALYSIIMIGAFILTQFIY